MVQLHYLNHFHSLLSSVVALRHVQWPTPALSVDALQAASKVPPHRLRTTAWSFLAKLSLTQTLCGYDAQTEAPPPLSSSHTLPLRMTNVGMRTLVYPVVQRGDRQPTHSPALPVIPHNPGGRIPWGCLYLPHLVLK